MVPCSLVEYYKRLNFFQTTRYHKNGHKLFRSIEIRRRKHKKEQFLEQNSEIKTCYQTQKETAAMV
jgi:hypothetical protein